MLRGGIRWRKEWLWIRVTFLRMLMMFRLFMMVRILQWNARSLIDNGQELKKLICAKIDLIGCKEEMLEEILWDTRPGYFS